MSASFGSVSASAAASSGSLPENLGVGRNAKAEAAAQAVSLSPQEIQSLNDNLVIVKKLLCTDQAPSDKELQALSKFTTEMIENPGKSNVAQALINLKKFTPKAGEPSLTDEDYAVNAIALFVELMKKGHVEVRTINEKFGAQAPLSYAECRLIDQVCDYNHFATEMVKAGVFDNSHINHAVQLNGLATANAFKDFKDGDVLFYDLAGRQHYYGPGPGVLENITMGMLGTNYCHVGIFYRDEGGRPCVAEIQGRYTRHPLKFGQMSFIKGKRVDPAKFTAATLSEKERLKAQAKLGKIFKDTISPVKDLKIGITMGMQLKSVFGHKTSEPNTRLGKVKVQDNVNLLCSELAGVGLMDAFDKYNKELLAAKDKRKALLLSNPFSEYEDLTHLHPERLLVAFGPNQRSKQTSSGWEDVPATDVNIDKMMPTLPKFPELSYPKAS